MPSFLDTLNNGAHGSTTLPVNADQLQTLLAGIASGVTGGPLASLNTMMAANKSRQAEGLVNKQISDLGSYFNQQTNVPFTQNPQVASALEILRNQLQGSLKANNTNAIRTGATAESQVAAQGNANNTYSDALNKLLGFSANRNDQLASNYQYRVGNLYNQLVALKQGQAQGSADAASQLSQLPFQALSTVAGNPEGFASLLKLFNQ